jgi:hypothetical protein
VGRKSDALAFDAEVRRRARTGDLGMLDAGHDRLDEFAAEWRRSYAKPTLAPRTVKSYAHAWELHVSPRIGGLQLREVTVQAVPRFAAEMETAGVGASTRRRVLMVLSSVLQRAVEWGRIPANPVRLIRKPSASASTWSSPWRR